MAQLKIKIKKNDSSSYKKVTFCEDPFVRDRIFRFELKRWLANEISYKEMKRNVDQQVSELVEAH
ncbi:MAG: hypothetical protein WBI14_10140 [Anaerolineaceae bacterium]